MISETSDPVSDPDRPFRPSRNGPTDRPSLGDPEDDKSKINFALPHQPLGAWAQWLVEYGDV